MGPKAGLDEWKISSPPGFDSDRPARSQSLFRLRYPAHTTGSFLSYNFFSVGWFEEVSKGTYFHCDFLGF